MTATKKIPYEQCLARARENLALGSADGLNLAELMIAEGALSLPLMQILRQQWNLYQKDKKNLALCEQVDAYRTSAVAYLKERREELDQQVATPVDPWTELAARPGSEREMDLRRVGEELRGALATAAAVLAPPTTETGVLAQVGEIFAGLLDHEKLRDLPLLSKELEALPVEEFPAQKQQTLNNLLVALGQSLSRGEADQAVDDLASARAALALAGRQVRWQVIEAHGTKTSPAGKCPACASPFLLREKLDYRFVEPGAKPTYVCQVCASTFHI